MPNKFVNKFCYILSISFLLFSTKHKNGHLFATKIESKKIAMLSGQKLDFHMRQFSFANLLKAKAENILPLVSEKERILFRQCADGANADDERELARCFLALFRARDEQKRRKMEGKIEGEPVEASSENPLARLIRTSLEMFWPPILQGSLQKQWNWWSRGNNQMANGHSEASENNIGRRNESEEAAAEAPIEIKWKLIMKREDNQNATVEDGNNGQEKKKMKRRRRRRKINDDQLPPSSSSSTGGPLSNIEKLKMIRRFFKAFNEYRGRIERFNEHRNAIQKAFPHLFTKATKKGHQQNENGENAKGNEDASKNNSNSATFPFEESENVSIFSPKLFSLFPSDVNNKNAQSKGERRKNAEIIREIFSPNLLSFYEEKDEGRGKRNNGSKIGQNGKFGGQIASIPQLLRLIISNRKSEDKWLNFLIQITGTGQILEKLHSQIRRFERVLREQIMPLAVELEGMALGMAKLEGTMGRKQKEYFKKNGYTFLSSGQMKLLANEGPSRRKTSPRMEKINKRPKGINDAQFPVIAEMMEEHMEDYIQEIGQMALAKEGENQQKQLPIEHAKIVQRIRRKRQLPISGPVVGILAPFAFQPQVNSLQLFTLYVLSPQAFIPSYFNPAMFYVQLLTPWAFLANLFSPQAFTCLCLSPVMVEANAFSPQFFYLELLSPTIMQANMLSPYFFLATILSPQIMIADLLNPTFFQYKIFSPQHFMAGLLSPNIGSPNIYSDQSHIFAVLSPNIASPNVYSKVSNSVFIFSPEILGGHGGERGYEEEGENVVTLPDEDHPTQGAGKFGIVHTHG